MDEFYRPQPQRGESQMAPSFVNRAGPSLPRRFTAESGHVPTLSSFIPGSQRPPEPTEFAATPAAVRSSVSWPPLLFGCRWDGDFRCLLDMEDHADHAW